MLQVLKKGNLERLVHEPRRYILYSIDAGSVSSVKMMMLVLFYQTFDSIFTDQLGGGGRMRNPSTQCISARNLCHQTSPHS